MDMASSNNSTMDPNLWGLLQQYIDLENVYLRLPLWSFFQLRGVCQEWNALAQQRRCFTERVQKPYFVIVYPATCKGAPYYAGILTLHIASGQWRWKRLPVKSSTLLHSDFVLFSVSGLVYQSFGDWANLTAVYDTHIRYRHYVRRLNLMPGRPRVLAMAVDTSASPYEFKIIFGGQNSDTGIHTHLLNSRSTKICPSRIPAITSQTWPTCTKSCLQWDDCVYTWWQTTAIQVYSLKEDKWTTLNPPEFEHDGIGGALGCWDNRLFVVLEDGELSVSVWELVDKSRQAWRPFARIPGEMRSWLVASAKESILASFCDRYVLMYTLCSRNNVKEGMQDHFVLFDLATKHWEKTSLWNNNPQSDYDDTQQLREHVGTSGRS